MGVAHDREPHFLVGPASDVPHQLREGVGDLGQRCRREVYRAGLKIEQGLLGSAHQVLEPHQRLGVAVVIGSAAGNIGDGCRQSLGVDANGADLVDQPEELGGIDPDALSERPGIDGSNEASEVTGLAGGPWGFRSLIIGLLLMKRASQSTQPRRQTGCARGRVGADGTAELLSQGPQRPGNVVGGIDLAVGESPPGVFDPLPGVGKRGVPHHAGGALDGVALANHLPG